MSAFIDAVNSTPLHPSELFGSAWTEEQHEAALRQRDPVPQLTYRGGPLLGAVRPVLVFWGRGWAGTPSATALSAPQSPPDYIAALEAFWRWVVASPLLDQLAEYGVPGAPIGHGSYAGAVALTQQALGPLVQDQQIQQLLQQQTQPGGALPQPDANTLYVVYTEPGTAIQQDGDQSCSVFCGYHDVVSGTPPLYYAALPYPTCDGCLGPMATLAALTTTSSHELSEAITDPIPGQGWYDDTYGEIGDICPWLTKELAPYTIQTEWSNKQGACV